MLLNALSSVLTKPSKPLLGLQKDHVLDDQPQKMRAKRFHLQQLAGPIDSLVGKSARNSAEFQDYSDSGPFELQNFHHNFIF
jgi:hypothetical protein